MPLTLHACLQLCAGYPSDIKGYLITLTVAHAWHMSSTVLVAQNLPHAIVQRCFSFSSLVLDLCTLLSACSKQALKLLAGSCKALEGHGPCRRQGCTGDFRAQTLPRQRTGQHYLQREGAGNTPDVLRSEQKNCREMLCKSSINN